MTGSCVGDAIWSHFYSMSARSICHFKKQTKQPCNFPGGPVVKALHFQCRVHGFDSWLGNSDPTCCMAWPKQTRKNLKRNEAKICKMSDVSQYMIIGKVIIKCSRSRKAQFCPNKYVVQANHTLPAFC